MKKSVFGNTVATGIATVSGVITAACVSALPSAYCAAMGESYAKAIFAFGVAALSGVFSIFFYHFGNESEAVMPSIGQRLFAVIGGVFLMLAVLSSSYNIKAATIHCLVGADADMTARLHSKIPTAGMFDFEMMMRPQYW